jgi:hypothetical protein
VAVITPLGGAEDDVFPLERAEIVHGDADGVRARLEVDGLKVAAFVADRDAGVTRRLGDDRNGGARNHLPLLVDNRTGNRSGDGLRNGWGRQCDPRRKHDDEAQRTQSRHRSS